MMFQDLLWIVSQIAADNRSRHCFLRQGDKHTVEFVGQNIECNQDNNRIIYLGKPIYIIVESATRSETFS